MPRPKPKRAEPTFVVHSHQLSAKAKSNLLKLLGHDGYDLLQESVDHQLPGMEITERELAAPLRLKRSAKPISTKPQLNLGKAIMGIEAALGLYVNGAVHIDEIPRPADYVSAFKPIEKQTAKLLNMVDGLGGYFSNQFAVKGVDQYSIQAKLIELQTFASNVVGDFNKLSSKGAKKNDALAEVVRRLRTVFRNYYRGQTTGRKKSGAIVNRGVEEKLELDFVQTAFLDLPRMNESKTAIRQLPVLFRDARCAVPAERAAMIERIANRVTR